MKKTLTITALIAVFFMYGIVKASTTPLASNKINFTSGDTAIVSFRVNGNAACKTSIESALTSNTGVVSASWDASSKTITVSFLSSVIKQTDLYPMLANAGYDNTELRAKKTVYDALPSSCQYARDPETE